jgi:cbb3-type cytochrome oxidase maturation protein
MDILYMLVPLSVVLVFLIVGVLAWSVWSGQFDDVEHQGERILEDDDRRLDTPPR